MAVTYVPTVWEMTIDELPEWPQWYRAVRDVGPGWSWYGYATRHHGNTFIIMISVDDDQQTGEQWGITLLPSSDRIVGHALRGRRRLDSPDWHGTGALELLREIQRLLGMDPTLVAGTKRT